MTRTIEKFRAIEKRAAADLIGLFALLKKQGARHGGMTGERDYSHLGRVSVCSV